MYFYHCLTAANTCHAAIGDQKLGSTGFLVEMLDLAQKYHANTGIFQSAFRRH
jgi:hypothetical protein